MRIRLILAVAIGMVDGLLGTTIADTNLPSSPKTAIFQENPPQPEPGMELQRLRNEGIALYESGIALDDALNRFTRAFALSHTAADAFNVALVYFKKNLVAETKTWLQRAQQQDPNFPNTYYLLGVLARSDGDFATAKQLWEQTLKLAPDDGYLHYQLAVLARAERNSGQFLQYLVNALALEPDNTAALYQMFGYYRSAGNMELAKDTLAKFNLLKKRETSSRRERPKDPSKLAQPILEVPKTKGFEFIATLPTFKLTELNPGCQVVAADRYLDTSSTAVQEAIALACSDGHLLSTTPLQHTNFIPQGQLPTDTSDIKLEWLDNQGPHLIAWGKAGLFAAAAPISANTTYLNLSPHGITSPPVLADLDSDGDVDIVSSNLNLPLTNAGQVHFIEELALYKTSPLASQLSGATALAAVDLQRDGLSDLLILRDNRLLVAPGTAAGFPESWELTPAPTAIALLTGDFTNDGHLDIALLMPGAVRFLWNVPDRNPKPVSDPSLNPTEASNQATTPVVYLDVALETITPRQAITTDFNNDGLLDLLLMSADGQVVMVSNHGTNHFTVEKLGMWPPLAATARFIPGDFDRDSREDLAYVTATGQIAIANNTTANAGHAIAIFARGVRAAPSGLATHIEVRRDSRYAYRQSTGGVQRLGIGAADYVEILRLEWTNGFVENKLKINASPTPYLFKESERIAGSCPSLFVWNGERFAYFDDAFISGPMGVPMDRGVYFPVQDRETIVIPAERIQLRDGKIEIRFTEELHETVFVDRARLLAVDHPAGTEVFPHSRLAPAKSPAEPFYLARHTIAAAHAQGSDGSDLTTILAYKDGVSAKFFNPSPHSGFSDPHWIELTLPDNVEPAQVDALLATGWFYYFVSTTMIAQAQASGPSLPWPWIQQHLNGAWEDVAPLGIPTGKTKTAVAPLKGLLKSRLLRIRSGISVYWDRIAFGLTGGPSDYKLTPTQLTESVVRFHGFSGLTARNPERFDYHAVHYASQWNPMQGHYTAYGAAEALISTADGRYAIFGSGDELAMTFTLDQPDPPPGQIRSYLLELVGYVKDGDRYTADGWRVEPIPYLGLNQYPAPQDERLQAAQTRTPFRTRIPLDFTLDTVSHP